MKDSYYFSHDTNAFLDPKIRAIISEFGVWSYGLFWVIIEMLASQRDYKTELKYLASVLYPLMQGKKVTYKSDGGIGYFIDDNDKRIDDDDVGCLSICLAKIEALLKMMIEVDLLKTDDTKKWVWSDSLNERMAKKEEVSEKRKIAGHLGGISRSKHLLSKSGSKIKQGKEIKGKEIKEKMLIKQQYLDFVLLTQEEHHKLVMQFGNLETNERIARLNDYIGSKGVKYKSHYHTILSWARKDNGKPKIHLTKQQQSNLQQLADLRKDVDDK